MEKVLRRSHGQVIRTDGCGGALTFKELALSNDVQEQNQIPSGPNLNCRKSTSNVLIVALLEIFEKDAEPIHNLPKEVFGSASRRCDVAHDVVSSHEIIFKVPIRTMDTLEFRFDLTVYLNVHFLTTLFTVEEVARSMIRASFSGS